MKIIQISACESADEDRVTGTLYALADDGSVWIMTDPWKTDKPRTWQKLPELPSS